jgi:hypothetical protein
MKFHEAELDNPLKNAWGKITYSRRPMPATHRAIVKVLTEQHKALGDWLVIDGRDMDEYLREEVSGKVWAFAPETLRDCTGEPLAVFNALLPLCEDGNNTILALIKDTCGLDTFIMTVVTDHGRGRTISHYDDEEHEVKVGKNWYFLYRVN